MRVCVVTSYPAAAEPRAPRHAVAARMAFPDAEVMLIDIAPLNEDRGDPPSLEGRRIERFTQRIPTRATAPIALAIRQGLHRLAHLLASSGLGLTAPAFSHRVIGLAGILRRQKADLYIAHNIDTLLAAGLVAEESGAALVFDCMEYYSDMGDGQSASDRSLARAVEGLFLPRCQLVIASSKELADVLADEYEIDLPLAAINAPSRVLQLPSRREGSELKLYWRNSTVGFGQRGLDDALVALSRTPPEIKLVVQGRPAMDGGAALRARLKELGLEPRVEIAGPYAAGHAVQMAAPFDVGLCLERRGPRNHDLTLSNKLFDYHMAGLAVVCTDLPSLAATIQRSGGGLTTPAGDPHALADVLIRLDRDRDLLRTLQHKAREFALSEANDEVETLKVVDALRGIRHQRVGLNCGSNLRRKEPERDCR